MIDIEKELAESLEELIDGIMDIRGVDIEDYFKLVAPEDQQQQHNPVSKPSHYNVADGIECITYIKQVLGNEGFVAYCRGNQIKYQHRAMYKGNPIEDLEKAHQYNAWAIETLKELPDE